MAFAIILIPVLCITTYEVINEPWIDNQDLADEAVQRIPEFSQFLHLYPDARVSAERNRFFDVPSRDGVNVYISTRIRKKYRVTAITRVFPKATGDEILRWEAPVFEYWRETQIRVNEWSIDEFENFGPAEWQQVFEADGDYSVIGYRFD